MGRKVEFAPNCDAQATLCQTTTRATQAPRSSTATAPRRSQCRSTRSKRPAPLPTLSAPSKRWLRKTRRGCPARNEREFARVRSLLCSRRRACAAGARLRLPPAAHSQSFERVRMAAGRAVRQAQRACAGHLVQERQALQAVGCAQPRRETEAVASGKPGRTARLRGFPPRYRRAEPTARFAPCTRLYHICTFVDLPSILFTSGLPQCPHPGACCNNKGPH